MFSGHPEALIISSPSTTEHSTVVGGHFLNCLNFNFEFFKSLEWLGEYR